MAAASLPVDVEHLILHEHQFFSKTCVILSLMSKSVLGYGSGEKALTYCIVTGLFSNM